MAETATAPETATRAATGHCALFDRKIVHENPYETIIPEIHRGPAAFFADNISIRQPGWVVRRAEDMRKIYSDAENFHKHGRSEEHTSELQSLMRISYAVVCLKKNILNIYITITSI